MTAWLIAAVALITYGSRAASLAFLPRPGARAEAVLARMPAPIFASLATISLLPSGGGAVPIEVLLAGLGALALAPRRSLALCLLGGALGYAVGIVVG